MRCFGVSVFQRSGRVSLELYKYKTVMGTKHEKEECEDTWGQLEQHFTIKREKRSAMANHNSKWFSLSIYLSIVNTYSLHTSWDITPRVKNVLMYNSTLGCDMTYPNSSDKYRDKFWVRDQVDQTRVHFKTRVVVMIQYTEWTTFMVQTFRFLQFV